MSTPLQVPVDISTQVRIYDTDTNELLVDKSNAIHRQNMALAIARGLARQDNGYIFRIAYGDGGTFRDAAGNLVYRAPNDGRDGGWEDRLYHETYSEIVSGPLIGTDPGSSDGDTTRPGGGSDPTNDPTGAGVVSQEVGLKSNVIVTSYINQNEPFGQGPSPFGPTVVADPDERTFLLDELGLYSSGAPATATHGMSGVIVNNANSDIATILKPKTEYEIILAVDASANDQGVQSCTIKTPAGGSGPIGEITYGDLCEGINTGSWIISGDQINESVLVYITDVSGGAYPTIQGKVSYGQLIFESKTQGTGSNVTLTCTTGGKNLFAALTNDSCALVNTNPSEGKAAGVANDPSNPSRERERLLTHMTFDPILKSSHRALKIVYILTISIAPTTDSKVMQINKT